MTSTDSYQRVKRLIRQYLEEHGATQSEKVRQALKVVPPPFLAIVAEMLREGVLDGDSYEPFRIWLPGQPPATPSETYVERATRLLQEELAARGKEFVIRDAGLLRFYTLLVLIKGKDVTLEDVHDGWAVWRTLDRADHHSIIPFDDLAEFVQEMDRPYAEAIRAAAAKL